MRVVESQMTNVSKHTLFKFYLSGAGTLPRRRAWGNKTATTELFVLCHACVEQQKTRAHFSCHAHVSSSFEAPSFFISFES